MGGDPRVVCVILLTPHAHTTCPPEAKNKCISTRCLADTRGRFLALHCVSQNQNAFQDFMLHAAPVTRQQRQVKTWLPCSPFVEC